MEKDIAELQKKLDSLHFSEEELSVCSAKRGFEETIANSHNSKKKQATREYDNWKQDHKESIWGWIFEKYREYVQIDEKKRALTGSLNGRRSQEPSLMALPEVGQRFRILEEFQYVDRKDGTYCLTDRGRLSSECNEGHPFLLTEYMLFLNEHLSSALCPPTEARPGRADCTIHDVLTVLALFLGEVKDETTRASVEGAVAEHIDFLREKAKKGYELERTHGIMFNGYWELNEEWVEPMQIWITGEHSLASLAHTYGLFEGAVQKAILKLAAILEELQALATLNANVELLKFLDEGRAMVLQDSILAESLYLRI